MMNRRLFRFLPWVVALGVMAWVLRQVPLTETWAALRGLHVWQIGVLALINGLVLAALNGRWWILLRSLGIDVGFLTLGGYRLGAFGLSYFTPGPHFGGEPLQVYLVEEGHGASRSSAVATMTLDKMVELLVNFGVLLLGATLVVRSRLLGVDLGREATLIPLALLALPVGILLATWHDQRPLSRVLGLALLLPIWQWQPLWRQRYGNAMDGLLASEAEAAGLLRNRPGAWVSAVAISVLSWLLMLAEFWLMVWFLGVALSPLALIAIMTAIRMAYLLPLPGGLGALEASLALAFGAVGAPAAIGISVALLIRARDVILGLVGLWWGSRCLKQVRSR